MTKKRRPTARERQLARRIATLEAALNVREQEVAGRTLVVERQNREIDALKSSVDQERAAFNRMSDLLAAERKGIPALRATIETQDTTIDMLRQKIEARDERLRRMGDSLELAVNTIIDLAPLLTPALLCRLADLENHDEDPSPDERLAMSALATLNTWMRRDLPSAHLPMVEITPPVRLDDGSLVKNWRPASGTAGQLDS